MRATWGIMARRLRDRFQSVAGCILRNNGNLRLALTRVGIVLTIAVCLLLVASVQPFTLFYSALHDKDALQQTATDLNHRRIDVAMDYFRRLPKRSEEELQRVAANATRLPSSSPSLSSPTRSKLTRFTIVIITVSRKKPEKSDRNVGYVLQSAAALDFMVRTYDLFRDSFLFICDVDLNPEGHKDAAVVKDYLPYVERYGRSVLPFPVPRASLPGRGVNSYDRERSDYVFCLQMASKFPSEHYIVFQDDAVPHPDFPPVLELSLSKLTKHQACRAHFQQSSSSSSNVSDVDKQTFALSSLLFTQHEKSCFLRRPPYTAHMSLQEQRAISPSPDTSFGYLKFYFPERWQGFAFEPLRILDLLSVGCVGGGLGLLLQAVYSWLVVRSVPQSRSLATFLLGIALTLILAQLVGRQNLVELRRLSKFFYRLQESPTCCAPAVLYPASVMPHLTEWLLESPASSKVDLRISALFQYHRIPMYSVEPNLVRHVGMVTSLKDKSYKKPIEEFLLSR